MSVQPSRAAGIVSRVASHETPGGLADPSAPIPAAASLYQDYVSRGGNLVRMATQNNRVSAMDKGTTWLGTGRGIYLGQFPVFESCGSCVHRHRQNKQPRGPESQSPSASRQSVFFQTPTKCASPRSSPAPCCSSAAPSRATARATALMPPSLRIPARPRARPLSMMAVCGNHL